MNAETVPAIAVVGAGYWGRNLVRNYAQTGALRLICDGDRGRLDELSRQYPAIECKADFSDVLRLDGIQGICIATPAETHFTLAKDALLAGKHVYLEKPFVLDEKDADELIALAKERGRILMVGHLLQYHPVFVRLKSLAANGDLGRINYIYSHRLNLGKIRREENSLWSFAPHDISMILALAGEEPEAVVATGGNYLHRKIADVTTTHLEFPSGLKAHIFVSWLHPFKEQKLVVVGDRKMAVFDDTLPWEDKLLLYPHTINWQNNVPVPTKGEAEQLEIPKDEPLALECRHFLDCIAAGNQPVTDGLEGLRVLKVLNAAQSSLDQGGLRQSIKTSGKGNRLTAELQEGEKPHELPLYSAHPSAVIDDGAEIGNGTKIWHFSHVLSGAKIGERCSFGQNVSVAGGTRIGNNVKVQNNVSIYEGTVIEDDVFLGPSCVLTNVTNPRSQVVRRSLYETTTIRRGASVGANATVVCGITIGRYAFVAAGAVVAKDVPDYALMVGVPARQQGWMSRHGHRLHNSGADGVMVCPESGLRYREVSAGRLRCLDLDEEAPLPPELAVGKVVYDALKKHSM
jgi:UDP-2-acetamido-3-amino-2,3-dideoxy-glucuronate N-acetyltransferase